MGADMALAEVGVLHVGQLVLAVFGTGNKRSAGQHGLGEAGAEQGHPIDEVVGQGNGDAGLDLSRGSLGDGRGNPVGCPDLVIGSEGRSLDQRLAVALGMGCAGCAEQKQRSQGGLSNECLHGHGVSPLCF